MKLPILKQKKGSYKKTHKDGWTIEGFIQENYYTWVNEFHANHPVFGEIYSDFKKTVFYKSKKEPNHFLKYHEPYKWDYGDI